MQKHDDQWFVGAGRFLRVARLLARDSKFHRRSFKRLKRADVDARYFEHCEITLEEPGWLSSEVAKLQELTTE